MLEGNLLDGVPIQEPPQRGVGRPDHHRRMLPDVLAQEVLVAGDAGVLLYAGVGHVRGPDVLAPEQLPSDPPYAQESLGRDVGLVEGVGADENANQPQLSQRLQALGDHRVRGGPGAVGLQKVRSEPLLRRRRQVGDQGVPVEHRLAAGDVHHSPGLMENSQRLEQLPAAHADIGAVLLAAEPAMSAGDGAAVRVDHTAYARPGGGLDNSIFLHQGVDLLSLRGHRTPLDLVEPSAGRQVTDEPPMQAIPYLRS